jgi:uncharacterized protein YlaI
MKCEICNKESVLLDKHHIHSRSLGGKDNPGNIALLCANCHKLIHVNLLIIEGKFPSTNAKGYSIVWRKYNEPNILGFEEPKCYISKDLRIYAS